MQTWARRSEAVADIDHQGHRCLCPTHPGRRLDPRRTPALARRALEAALPPSAPTAVTLQLTALSPAAAQGLDPSHHLHLGVQLFQEMQRTGQTLPPA